MNAARSVLAYVVGLPVFIAALIVFTVAAVWQKWRHGNNTETQEDL